MASKAGAHHTGHHRDPAGHPHLVIPHLRIIIPERIQILGPGSSAIQEIDNRYTLLQSYFVNMVCFCMIHLSLRSSHDSKVVIDNRNTAAIDLPHTYDHPVCRRLFIGDFCCFRELAELEKCPGIAEEL